MNIRTALFTVDIFSFIVYSALIGLSINQYKKWKLNSLLNIIAGSSGLLISSLLDMLSRFQDDASGPAEFIQISIMLRLSGVFFYIGSLMILKGLLETQTKVKYSLMLVYAFFYGQLCLYYVLPETMIVYYSDVSDVYFIDPLTYYFWILDLLTALPFVEIVYNIIKRIRMGMINQRSKISFYLFFIGLTSIISSPVLSMFVNTNDVFPINNMLLLIGFVLGALSFIINPLVFSITHANLFHMIIVKREANSIPLVIYEWYSYPEGGITPDLASAALSGTEQMLSEIVNVSEKQTETNVEYINLGTKDILIEYGDKFMVYLTGEHLDRICRAGMQFILRKYEKEYENQNIKNLMNLDKTEFENLVQKTLSFAQSGIQSN